MPEIEALAKDPSLPLHFALQFYLLAQAHKLQFHPKMKNYKNSEQMQLMADWKELIRKVLEQVRELD